jgi:hypothetical protein
VTLTINTDDPNPTILEGTCHALRKAVIVMPKGKDTGKVTLVDRYVFNFDDGAIERGFEGNGMTMLVGFDQTTIPPTYEDVRLVGFVFQGTGAFEGQTLNVRRQLGGPMGLNGYWLNYEP